MSYITSPCSTYTASHTCPPSLEATLDTVLKTAPGDRPWGRVFFGHAGSSLQHADFSTVVGPGLHCPAACGILVPQPAMESSSPALEGEVLITGPAGKSS